MKYRPTAAEAALLVVYLQDAYDAEKGRQTTRFRVSSETLRRVCGRHALRGSFVEDFENEIADLGWSPFWVGNNLALIRTDTIDGWPRIASKRIAGTLRRVEKGDPQAIAEIEAKLERISPKEDDTDTEESKAEVSRTTPNGPRVAKRN